MKCHQLISVCALIAATVGFAASAPAQALPSTPCYEVLSCTVDGITFTEAGGTSGNGLTFMASFNPGNQNPSNVAGDVQAFLTADGQPGVAYLGRAGDSSTFFDGDSVSVTGNGNLTGNWTFDPGTTNDVGAYVAIHAGDGTVDNLYSIDTPGDGGNWGTNNGHGLSNFDLFGQDPPAAVPEPFTLSLFGAGVAGVAAMRRRKKKAA